MKLIFFKFGVIAFWKRALQISYEREKNGKKKVRIRNKNVQLIYFSVVIV